MININDMNFRKLITGLIMALMWSVATSAYCKGGDGAIRILAIGNSFSEDAVENYLWDIAASDGKTLIIGNMYIPGCPLERHLGNARADKAEYRYRKTGKEGIRVQKDKVALSEALADEDWDYVSFQQSSPLSGLYETWEASLPELVSYVRERVPKKTKFILHQTWAYQGDSRHSGFSNYGRDQMRMWAAITDAVQKAAKSQKIKTIVPSGTAVQNLRTSYMGDHVTRDGYHLDKLIARDAAACAWYGTLAGRSVLGNAYCPEGLSEDGKRIAQRAAHEAVLRPFEVTSLRDMPENILYKDASAPVEMRVEDLLSRMTMEEKVLQLNQYMVGVNDNVNNIGETVEKIPAELGSVIYIHDDAAMRNALQRHVMENSRLGIPMIFGYDVIHGFRTIFPIPLAQAASWNPSAVERSCSVAAAECNASGVDWTFSPMVDVARDGRWGRISEGYGEDPYAASVYCAAAVKGYQGDDLAKKGTVAACLKHYVGYGASEAGRDYVPTEISRQSLWDTYLPPFEAGVKAGAATLMSSFNLISGVPATSNAYTLTEVLKKRWGHDGFVVSDWDAVKQIVNQGVAPDGKEAARLAFNAGVEMDMVDDLYRKYLPELIREGKVSMELLDESVRRVLRVKFRLGLFENPYIAEVPEDERLLLPEYLDLAENVAQETMVLLKNAGGLLPLRPDGARIAVIGPVAFDSAPLMGNWAGRGRVDEITCIYDALVKEFGDKAEFVLAKGCDFEGSDESGFAEAFGAAGSCDAVILCLGEKRDWSGENCSRSSIALPVIQEKLLAAVHAAGKPVIVLLSSGRPLDLARIEPMADAMLEIWQPGTMGGHAVAGILSGRYNPSGKLPVTFPYTTGQIPIYYNRRNSGRRGTQGLYKDITSEPMYEFAHGLSYSEFSYSPVTLSCDSVSASEKIVAEVTVTNTSDVDGMETVHWFICDPYCSIARPVKELKFFEKRLIKAGESSVFRFEIDPWRDLSFVDVDGNRFLEPGEYRVIVKNQKIEFMLVE